MGDQVLVQQEKLNKPSMNFKPVPHTVVSKNGNSTVVESPSGAQYSRNTCHIKKFIPKSHIPEEKIEIAVTPEGRGEEVLQSEPRFPPHRAKQALQTRPQCVQQTNEI